MAAVAAGALVVAAPALASPGTGALQVALRAHGVYKGPLDGVRGPSTVDALRAFQQRQGLPTTGLLDRRTRLALGRLGRPLAGTRAITVGAMGWDVSWLEFMLAKRGFDPGAIDGRFTKQTKSAVVAFARFAGIEDRCHAHPPLFPALRRGHAPRPRLQLSWPVQGKVTRQFGIHGARLVPGVTLAAGFGTGVAAAADGRVIYAAQSGPLGLTVMLKHPRGVVTVYGHLARIDVRPGDPVLGGALIGLVGETGKATQPGLYFEVRVRGAAVDPLAALGRP